MGKKTVLLSIVLVLVAGTGLFVLVDFIQRYAEMQRDLETSRLEGTSVAATLQALTEPNLRAEPFTIAFVSDTETMSRWDEILELIRAEGAEMIIHNGDYVDGINPETMEPATLEDLISAPVLDADGRPTGEFDCDRQHLGIRCVLGADFPVLGSAVGKSFSPELEDYFFDTLQRIESQDGTWGGCLRDGEIGEPGVRMNGCFLGDNLSDARAADYWVRWRGVTMVFQNVMPDTTWVTNILQADDNVWKLCLWHGNHTDFQTGSKGSAYDGRDHSLPYEMYQNCANAGALVINGNEHVYSRTCVLEDIGNMENGGPGTRNRVNRRPGTDLENHGAVCPSAGLPNEVAANTVEELEIGPGRTMVLVSALPGYAWREYVPSIESEIEQDAYRHENDGWWATMYTLNRYCRNNCTTADLSAQNPDAFVPGMNPPQKVERPPEAPWDPYSDAHGVLFITFNYQGDAYKAHGYFKKLNPDPETGREIVDEFIITYRP